MRPNVLFILSDQHNPRIIGYEGNAAVATPNLDALAGRSAEFRNAYCQNPLCVPSRSSLITGRYSKSTGIYDNQHILEPNSPTMPRTFAAAGYRTCLVGKAHFNGEQFHGYGQRPYGDLFGQAHQPDPRRTPDKGESGLGHVLGNSGPSGIPDPLTQTEICVAETAKWLQTHVATAPEQPFFLSVHFDKPHFPINPPERYYRMYENRLSMPEVPEGWLDSAPEFVRAASGNGAKFGFDPEVHLRALTAYYGCVSWVDDAVGRILGVLDYLGLEENTIVVYSTDHGENAGEHGLWQKTVFYEASARVPLLLSWPGHIEGGRRDEIVGLIDLYPSLCSLAGIDIPRSCEGEDLSLILSGQGSISRDALFSESVVLKQPEHAGCMIRTGTWKYCLYLDGDEELFDLEADPGELDNRAEAPELVDLKAGLKRRVVEFWEPDNQRARYDATPKTAREKHFYPYSNQFLLGNGTVVDARP